MTIWFDMDGTIADLYGMENWLECLRDFDPTPYEVALPLVYMPSFARLLNALQKRGHRLGIISWLSKVPDPEYDEEVTDAKLDWLADHLPSVKWDEINIVPAFTPKENFKAPGDWLFDDEQGNRDAWGDGAFDADNILETLRGLL